MGLLEKSLWYDWKGGNEWLFAQINHAHSEWSDRLAMLFNRVGDHHHFPYIMGGLLAVAILDYIFRLVGERAATRQRLVTWLGVFIVLAAAYVVDGAIIHMLKDYFAYPRPYHLLGESVHVLDVKSDPAFATQSFPSGHAAFITMLALGLAPVLSGGAGLLASLLVVGVCWARIASGLHFPADVLGGFLIAWAVVSIVRAVVASLMQSFFGLKC